MFKLRDDGVLGRWIGLVQSKGRVMHRKVSFLRECGNFALSAAF
jgi:hypothetical protein